MNHGSQPIKPDPRDDNFTRLYGAPVLPSFPKTLNCPRKSVKNQGSTLSCTKQTTELAAEYQDGEEMSAEWAWEELKAVLNDPNPQGAQPRDAMSLNCKLGSLPLKEFTQGAILRHIAEKYRKAAYIRIPKVGDWFDTIRAALLNGQYESQIVMAFGTWYDEWNAKFIPTSYSQFSGWHAYSFIDFDTVDGKQYLVAQNSYGQGYGYHGRHYFPRETINREFAKFGTGLYVFKDLTPEQIENAKKLTIAGRIQKAIIDAWWRLSQIFGGLSGGNTYHDQLAALLKRLSVLLGLWDKAKTPSESQNLPPSNEEAAKEKEYLLDSMLDAVEEFEGFYAPEQHPRYPNGTRSWRNMNPGNLKYAKQPKAIGKDDKGFAKFRTYADGREALANMILNAARGKSRVYKPTMTLAQFFSTYAPSTDHNNPAAYANYVAKQMGVATSFVISNLA